MRLSYSRWMVAACAVAATIIGCSGKSKTSDFREIRDIRYTRTLSIELKEPGIGLRNQGAAMPAFRTSDESFDVWGTVGAEEAKIKVLINGTEHELTEADSTGAFEAPSIPLVEGENEIVVKAFLGSRANEMRLLVVREPSVKTLQINSPAGGSKLRERWVTVRGEAFRGLRELRVNGIAAKRRSENEEEFVAEGVPLEEGMNTLALLGKDESGTLWRVTTKVACDTQPPKILLDFPARDTVAGEPKINVKGRVDEPDAVLVLNDETVPLAEDGSFETPVALERRDENIELIAVDGAGNRTRLTRTVRLDATELNLSILSPAPGSVISRLPARFELHATKVPLQLALKIDGREAIRDEMPASPFNWDVERLEVADGEHRFDIVVTDASGMSAERSLVLATDIEPPRIEIAGVTDGSAVESTVIDVIVQDASVVRNSVRVTLNGEGIPPRTLIDHGRYGTGKKTLRVEAQDRHGRTSTRMLTFQLAPNRLKAYIEGVKHRWRADPSRKQRLITPLLGDLQADGSLARWHGALGKVTGEGTARGSPMDAAVIDAFIALDGMYPAAASMPQVRSFYGALKDLADHGTLYGLAEAHAGANRIGAWKMLEEITLPISTPDEQGHTALTDIVLIVDVLANYAAVDQMLSALSKLPEFELDGNGRTKGDMFDIPLETAGAFLELPRTDAEGLLDYQAKLVDEGTHRLVPRGIYEVIESHGRTNVADSFYEPLSCVLSRQKRPHERLLASWSAFIGAYLRNESRVDITHGVMRILHSALMEDVLDSLSILMDYDDLPAVYESFQVLSSQQVFDKAMTDLGKILAASDNEGRPVTFGLLTALDGFFERDEVHPQQMYAETILDGVERLLARDSTGRNSLEIVLDVFLDDLTREQRLRFGDLFKYHTLPSGEKVPAQGRERPSDNVRLLKLLDTAYSPLSCGIPVAFTSVVVPVNVPGIPIEFPTDNLAVAAFEASAQLKAGTAEKLATLFDVFVGMASFGDLFCEPNILAAMVSDPAPVRSLLKTTPLAEVFTLIQALAKRGDAPYLVEMLHAIYLSGAAGSFAPTLNAVFEQGVFENSIAALQAVRDTRLPSNPDRRALGVFLDYAAYALKVPPGRRQRLVRSFVMLLDRVVSDETLRNDIRAQLQFVAQVLNDPPKGLDLRELDDIAGEIVGCDKDAVATRAFAQLLDDNRHDGDWRPLSGYARAYLGASPELAVSFNRFLKGLLDRDVVPESLLFIQQWLLLDRNSDRVLSDSLASILRPDDADRAPVDPLLYALLKTATPALKANRGRIVRILESRNRAVARRAMEAWFSAMKDNEKVRYARRMIPAAAIFMERKIPGRRELEMNEVMRGVHSLLRDGVTQSLTDMHTQAHGYGYYDFQRKPDLIEALSQVLSESLQN